MAFSTTLTADLGAGDLLVSVASNVGARTTYPWRATVGSEVIYVTGGVEEGLDWTVLRGADDTDPTEHLTGALLTASGGVALFLRLSGPFQIDWNTPGAIDPVDVGLELGDELAIGSVVMPFAVVRAAFDDEATADVGVGVAPTDFISAINYTLVNVTLSTFGLVEAHNPDSSAFLRLNMAHRVVVTGTCKLMVAVYSATQNITQGSIDVYAIIATPA